MNAMRPRFFTWLALAVLAGCGDSPAGPGDGLQGGALATFQVSGEQFRVWVTNDEVIQQIFDLRDGISNANIPNGVLHAGPGIADHNAPWLWHLDAEEIQMAEFAIEVCDGRPSLVDSLLEDYLTVGRFCPWGAELVSIDDRR
jgi:hypothetical protein